MPNIQRPGITALHALLSPSADSELLPSVLDEELPSPVADDSPPLEQLAITDRQSISARTIARTLFISISSLSLIVYFMEFIEISPEKS